MPKRPNPFGESSPLQYKTHIGKRELDMGVNMEQNMQTVYDRTKTLLYEGSRKSTECSACGDAQQWSSLEGRDELLQPLPGQMRLDPGGRICGRVDTSPIEPHSRQNGATSMVTDEVPHVNGAGDAPANVPRSPSKQLQIDSQGKLYSGDTEMAMASTHAACTPGFCICRSCNRPTHIGTRKCHFCDKAICSSCISQCYSCQGIFCPVCSVLNYDDFVERSYCLQCPSKMV